MSALLEERGKRHQGGEAVSDSVSTTEGQKSLESLVESVKRRSHGAIEGKRVGKRRKLVQK
jgi:hypothetical protein